MVREHGVEYMIHVGEGDTRAAMDALCRTVHAELPFLGFLRPGEQVCMKREDMQAMICPPDRAEGLGVEPFVVLPLLGVTKTSPTEAAGVVVAWVTASGLRVGEHVTELLQMYKDDGEEEGALLTHHGRAKRAWSKAFALHRVPRPALRKLQKDGRGIEPGAKLKEYTSNTLLQEGRQQPRAGPRRHEAPVHGPWEMGIEMGRAWRAIHGGPVRSDRHGPEAVGDDEDGVERERKGGTLKRVRHTKA
jgi:hypothetical protein